MKISASLFSKKSEWLSYANQLEYAGIDYIHIDYLEGTTPPIEIEALTPTISQLPYDVHVISKRLSPDTVLALNQTPTKYFCVQYEQLEDKRELDNLQLFNGLHGIAFTMDTPFAIMKQYVGAIDFVLIMCSTPGVSGAEFDERNIERIRLIRKQHPDLPIHVDGGINNERIKWMEDLGVSLCVSGSYLASTEGMELIYRVCELKFRNSDAKAMDIMTLRKNLVPIMEQEDFCALLENINQSQMGTAFVENQSGGFVGIITDGDVRRAALTNRDQVFSLRVGDVVNRTPYYVSREKKLSQIFLERMLLQKRVTVIPVVENQRLVGMMDLKKYF